MRGALALAAAAIAGVLLAAFGEEARAEDMLRSTECPFGRGDIPVSHIARCYRFSREAVPVDVTFDVAVIARPAPKPAGSVIYIPGGPGDAPVAAVPPPETLLAAFADHAVVMFNPRGVTGSDPAPSCDFGAALWVEEFGGEAVLEQVRACRAAVEERVDPAAFDAARIAEDVTALAKALNLRKAGIYGVSYGTEVALHLLDSAPGWLGFAILDSVSLPGVAGAPEELSARDRFLSRLDTLCFAEEKCSEFVDAPYGSLTAWAAQFDASPLQFALGPQGEEWRLDGPEMLDYLASLSAYPLGLEYALDLVDMLETSRLGAVSWMREDITQSIEFAADSLALTMEAYGDSVRASDEAVIESVPQYPSDLDDLRALYAIYRAWNRTGREEMPFPARPRPDPAPTTPVLVMSGLVDSVTPVEWANALHGRYAGLRHYGFPDLGHAVSFAAPEEATLPPLGETLACAQSTLRSFIKTPGADAGPCEKFRLRGAE